MPNLSSGWIILEKGKCSLTGMEKKFCTKFERNMLLPEMQGQGGEEILPIIPELTLDQRVVNDLTLGRRISFYELRGEIGCGNVRLGIHTLNKGKEGYRLLVRHPFNS
uniref:Uncharacterized protein n=1 Tax=Salmo trutta TaxID=8032 RepID=A0A674C0T7_SALTR